MLDIGAFGLRISAMFRRLVPDPFVIAIGLTVVTAVLALVWGDFPGKAPDTPRALALLDAWRGDGGLWKLLAFGMQMCLILVTGHALASTRPVRAGIDRLARLPRSNCSAAVLVSAVACGAGLINWGLGLIVGATLAREVGRALHTRGIPVHYPLLASAGYMGLLVFHGGLSASAPLSATTEAGASRVLPPEAVALLEGGVGLERTLLSPLNLFVTGGLLIIIPALFALLAPSRTEEMQPPPPMPAPPLKHRRKRRMVDRCPTVSITRRSSRGRSRWGCSSRCGATKKSAGLGTFSSTRSTHSCSPWG